MKNDNALDKLHLTQLEIFDEFVSICKKHNLEYFLIGGTLLGAVRHKGFIPWDDDIDVAMPQKDYLEFLKISSNEINNQFFVDSIETNNNYFLWFAKVKKKNTIFSEKSIEHLNNIDKAIFIDIFPYINISDFNNISFKIRVLLFKIISNIIMSKKHIYNSFKRKILNFITFLIPTSFFVKLETKLLFMDKNNNSNYIGSLYSTYGTEVFNRKDFFPLKKIKFENRSVYGLNNNDQYLKTMYGDYMKLPPVEKRVTHMPLEIKFGDEDE